MIQCEVYKERSNAACLRAAFDLMCTNFMLFLRRTWMAALVFSVLSSLSLVFNDSPIAVVLVVVSILAMCLLYSCCMGEIVEQRRGSLFLRLLKVNVLNIVVVMLFTVLVVLAVLLVHNYMPTEKQPSGNVGFMSVTLITIAIYIVAFVVLLPTYFSSMKYVVEPQMKLRGVYGKAYKEGWHSWGYLFVVAILTFLIAAIVLGVAYLPIIVLASAKSIDASGVLLGDVSALPKSFALMSFCTGVIASFINAYVMIWLLLTWYYAYGRISAMHKS